jgi:tetratricopeptide (TPR) repeat protein
MHDLGLVYRDQGRFAEAIDLLEPAAKTLEHTCGATYCDTVGCKGDLAALCQRAGRLDQALAIREELLTTMEARQGPEDPGTLNSMKILAREYRKAGKFVQADRLLRKLLERGRNLARPNSVRISDAMEDSGLLALEQGKHADAEHLMRECLAMREENQPDHWKRFNTSSLLGAVKLDKQQFTEAEPLLLQGYEGLKQRETTVPPEQRERLTEAAGRLVRLYEATSQPEKARIWREKLAAPSTPVK